MHNNSHLYASQGGVPQTGTASGVGQTDQGGLNGISRYAQVSQYYYPMYTTSFYGQAAQTSHAVMQQHQAASGPATPQSQSQSPQSQHQQHSQGQPGGIQQQTQQSHLQQHQSLQHQQSHHQQQTQQTHLQQQQPLQQQGLHQGYHQQTQQMAAATQDYYRPSYYYTTTAATQAPAGSAAASAMAHQQYYPYSNHHTAAVAGMHATATYSNPMHAAATHHGLHHPGSAAAGAGGASAAAASAMAHHHAAATATPPPLPNHVTDPTGQTPPPGIRPKLTTTMWEDENTLCFQVEVRGICVARREDNNMINGTKLLNVAGMTRGRRDGLLKGEKTRHVVKAGAMHLKGVWIPYGRALDFANREKILDLLYPLFVDNLKSMVYLQSYPPRELGSSAGTSSSSNSTSAASLIAAATGAHDALHSSSNSNSMAHQPSLGHTGMGHQQQTQPLHGAGQSQQQPQQSQTHQASAQPSQQHQPALPQQPSQQSTIPHTVQHQQLPAPSQQQAQEQQHLPLVQNASTGPVSTGTRLGLGAGPGVMGSAAGSVTNAPTHHMQQLPHILGHHQTPPTPPVSALEDAGRAVSRETSEVQSKLETSDGISSNGIVAVKPESGKSETSEDDVDRGYYGNGRVSIEQVTETAQENNSTNTPLSDSTPHTPHVEAVPKDHIKKEEFEIPGV